MTRDKLGNVVRVLTLSVLMGFVIGAGSAMTDLSDFSRVPVIVFYVFPVLAGILVGALTQHLGQAIGTLLLVLTFSALVDAMALAYPELRVERLGREVALELSAAKALLSLVVVSTPLALVGLLMSKLIGRGD